MNFGEARSVARPSLETIERVAAAAKADDPTPIGRDSLAFGVPDLDGNFSAFANNLSRARKQGNDLLRQKPLLARVVTETLEGETRTFYIAPHAVPGSAHGPDGAIASELAPIGRLASLDVGADDDIAGQNYRVIERAVFFPEPSAEGWDSIDTRLETLSEALTLSSLRTLLEEQGGEGLRIEDLAEDDEARQRAIDARMEDEPAVGSPTVDLIRAGFRRRQLERIGLRAAPTLDTIQDAARRMPLDTRLILLGPPGTGKTTTLVKRLQIKLHGELDADDRRAIHASFAGDDGHQDSWTVFTPTELLAKYVKEALINEGVAAPDSRVRTWENAASSIARDQLRIVRAGDRKSGAVVSTNYATLQGGIEPHLALWADDFAAFQTALLRSMVDARLQTLRTYAPAPLSSLIERIAAACGNGSTLSVRATLRLHAMREEIMERQRELADLATRIEDRELRRLLSADLDLLDDLFLALPVQEEEADTDEEEEDHEVEARPVSQSERGTAKTAFRRALIARARQSVGSRAPQANSRNAVVIEYLGSRLPDTAVLKELGQLAETTRCLAFFRGIVRQQIERVSSRYSLFRRERRAEGRWYGSAPRQSYHWHPHERDLVLLTMLRTGRKFLEASEVRRAPEDFPSLEPIRRLLVNQIIVDEATDFSPLQLAAMASLVDPAVDAFSACGDFNQRLTTWGVRSTDDLEWSVPGASRHEVATTYRHTRPLKELAQKIAAMNGVSSAPEVALPSHTDVEGPPPIAGFNLTGDDLGAWLVERIAQIETELGKLPTVAVLVNEKARVETLAESIRKHTFLNERSFETRAFEGGDSIGRNEDVRVFDISHIKGLEFEAVFFVDVDKLAEQEGELLDKFLYVGATRAAAFLGLTTGGNSLPARLSLLAGSFGDSW